MSSNSPKKISLKTTKEDLLRHSQLHSWYKHLDIEGDWFYATLIKGQQARNGFHPEITDYKKPHWLIDRCPKYTTDQIQYKFKLNCFWRKSFDPRGSYFWTSDCWSKKDHLAYKAFVSKHYRGQGPKEVWRKEHNRQFWNAMKVISAQMKAGVYENTPKAEW